MIVTRNISRSALSILELFKFVSSLSLLNAVTQLLLPPGGQAGVGWHPSLDRVLLFVCFVLLFVRFYHGNSLHLLEVYSEDNTVKKLDRALVTDTVFILLQGIVLTFMSFAVVDWHLFLCALLGLLVTDVVWSGALLRLDDRRGDDYLRGWFKVNSLFSVLSALLLLVSQYISPVVGASVLLVGVGAHTVSDYKVAWRRYFPAPEHSRIMIGAPFTGKLVDSQWLDDELKAAILRVASLCQQNGFSVYSAHVIERFGKSTRAVEQYVPADIHEAKRASVYIGITDGTPSNGLAVELGLAAASGTEVVLFVKHATEGASFLEAVVAGAKGKVIRYSDPGEIVRNVYDALGCTTGLELDELESERKAQTMNAAT